MGVNRCGERVPQCMRCNSLINSSSGDPLIETTLDLSGGDPVLELAEKHSLGFNEDLLASFQMPIQDSSYFGVKKPVNDLPTLSLDHDPFLQQIDVTDIEVDKFREPDTGMQKEGDDYQVAVHLPLWARR